MNEPTIVPANAPLPPEVLLTQQFYQWEGRGRGWWLWDYPVEIEPPFRPFFGHYLLPGPVYDDARKPTFLSSLADRVKERIGLAAPTAAFTPFVEETEPDAECFEDFASVLEIQAALPADTKITKDGAEQFVMSLGDLSRPVSFEVLGTKDSIVVQMACGAPDRRPVREQLHAYFPDALLVERSNYLRDLWDGTGSRATAVIDYGLSNEFMRPLRSFERFDPDPLAGAMGAMGDLGPEEIGLLQVLFVPVRFPWPENVVRAVTDHQGESFFADDSEIVSLASRKIARPLFAAVIRVAAQSPKSDHAWRIAQAIGRSLKQFADPLSNELIPLENTGYDDDAHAEDVMMRRSRRTGMLLNSDELVSLVHLPSASVRAEKLKREERKTKAAPTMAIGHQVVLGENQHSGKTVRVTVSAEHRARHTHVIGASGTGKSTLLLNLIDQDIRNGEGFAVLDPHGDLVDQVLERIPKERWADVVLFDPSDEAYPVGFNILSAHSDLERNLLASDLVSVFRRLSTSWGDQMTSVLGNAILAMLESSEGGTLADLRRFLVEADYRARFLQTVQDEEVVYYWRKEFTLLTGRPQGPILTRLDTFLRPKVIRHIVSQHSNRLDFAAVMNRGQIFLAKLAQGLIGEENSYLLGTILVSKLNQMAMSRQDMKIADRRPFYLYIDEFHNFVTPSVAAILSGARKYGLGLILAHQEFQQLATRDTDVAAAVISNPYTRICFRMGDFDAKKLADGFSYFSAKDLQNLGIGEAICRIERSDYDFNLKTLPLPAIDPTLADERRKGIIALSRERYATPREEVQKSVSREKPIDATEPRVETPVERKRLETQIESTPRERTREAVSSAISPLPPAHQAQPTSGRGGQQHKYLQQLIKRWAEDRGYRATIEKKILDGMGNVDVALEKGERQIACEISVTTSPEHEVGNVQKCLAAGFECVCLIAVDKKTARKLKGLLDDALSETEAARVRLLTPEELFLFLDSQDAEAAQSEKTVRGYKVKVHYKAVGEDEHKMKKHAISQVVVQALKRLRP